MRQPSWPFPSFLLHFVSARREEYCSSFPISQFRVALNFLFKNGKTRWHARLHGASSTDFPLIFSPSLKVKLASFNCDFRSLQWARHIWIGFDSPSRKSPDMRPLTKRSKVLVTFGTVNDIERVVTRASRSKKFNTRQRPCYANSIVRNSIFALAFSSL